MTTGYGRHEAEVMILCAGRMSKQMKLEKSEESKEGSATTIRKERDWFTLRKRNLVVLETLQDLRFSFWSLTHKLVVSPESFQRLPARIFDETAMCWRSHISCLRP